MARYRFVSDYRSHVGAWSAGDVAEFDDPELVAWINRDVAGCLVSADEPEPERAIDAPPHDRQIKSARNRSIVGTSADPNVMTPANSGAVKRESDAKNVPEEID